MKKTCFHTIGLLTIIGIISGCCSWDYSKKEFEFTQQELNLIGSYKVGDTIYFESNFGDIDTITILNISEEKAKGNRCFISKPPYHRRSITIKHLPNDEWAGITQTEDGERKPNYQLLISISKFPVQKKTDYSIGFKGFVTLRDSGIGKFQKECFVNGRILYDCYKATHDYPERVTDPDDIEIVYWTAEYGLTAYTSKTGETWLFKNLQ